MVALTSLTKIIDNLKLNSNWTQVTLGSNLHSIYLIAIKEVKESSNTIDPKDIISVQLELGIESGISGEYIVIQRCSLNFQDFTSSKTEINEKTAFIKLDGVPSNFYIRPISVQTASKQLNEGQTNIDINLSPFELI